MKKLFLLTLLLALPILANAYDAEIDGIYYNLNSSSKEAEVTSCGTLYSGSVTIPEKFTYDDVEYSVTSIGERAFLDCTNLTSVTIPSSVIYIGDSAFTFCSIQTIHISDLVAWCKIIRNVSSDLCCHHLYLNGKEIKDLVIPNTVTSIGDRAFAGCGGLTSLTIPNSVTNIGEGAFSGCSGLNSIKVVSGNTVYDSRDNSNAIFATKTNMLIVGCKNTNIPSSVTSIGDWAFAGSGLTSVTIPNSVTSIGDAAFYGCGFLTSVTIPNGSSAFESSNLTSITIPNSVTRIGDNAFFCCFGLTTLSIPNSVTTIGNSAFDTCINLTSVSIGNSVTIIGDYAFGGCSSLTTVISKIENPCSINNFCFPTKVFNNTTLYVPKGTIEKYKSTYFWNKFLHIKEGSPFELTLTYIVDDDTYSTYTLEEGDVIIPEETPTKEGYTFSGWSDIPETMPANDVTITGTFIPNKYKLTYMVDGEEYKTSEIDFGTAITAETAPTKEGYTFSGWSEIPSIMPANDVTVTGTFTVNKYIITYVVDDQELIKVEVDYGSTITPPKSQKDGYEIQWSAHPTIMPAYDLTIYGSYITTSIERLAKEENEKQVYTPDGRRVDTPHKGLNIIRMSDGTVKKVVVK